MQAAPSSKCARCWSISCKEKCPAPPKTWSCGRSSLTSWRPGMAYKPICAGSSPHLKRATNRLTLTWSACRCNSRVIISKQALCDHNLYLQHISSSMSTVFMNSCNKCLTSAHHCNESSKRNSQMIIRACWRTCRTWNHWINHLDRSRIYSELWFSCLEVWTRRFLSHATASLTIIKGIRSITSTALFCRILNTLLRTLRGWRSWY